MSARRRRRGHHEEEEHENEERWMASYMDMVTVLMCMFIVLFAMSTVDQKKFEELKNSLATGFGEVTSQKIDTASGVIVPPKNVDHTPQPKTDLQLARLEVQNLQALEAQLRAALARHGLESSVAFKIDERGLTIGLVGSETFFASNRAELSAQATQVLDDIGPILNPTPYQVSVEGHADLRQPGSPYPTNWELSAGRATSVLRHLVETNGFPQARIAAVSYGSARPLAAGTSDHDLAVNRRVDIVVLSTQPDRVRALIPQALLPTASGP